MEKTAPQTARGAATEEVARVVQLNIQDVYDHAERHRQSLTAYERVANSIADYCGRPEFVIFHAFFFTVWILINTGVVGMRTFDPYPFGLLTTIVSLEAIFLSLFVLLSQSRMQKLSDRQSQLDLQVNLLTEHELTRVLIVVDKIAKKLGIEIDHAEEIEELKADTAPHAVLQEIERLQDEPLKEKAGRPESPGPSTPGDSP